MLSQNRILQTACALLFAYVSPGFAGAQAPDPLDDPAITRQIELAFHRNFRLSDIEISVTTIRGAVTLKGNVTTNFDRRIAERVAQRIAGVRSVANLIEVVPAEREDLAISQDIEFRMRTSPFLQSKTVQVEVNNGMVTLTGIVPSWNEFRRTEGIVNQVPGVRQIVNRLQVDEPEPQVSDEQIKENVENTFKWDAYLAGLGIEVFVEAGIVTLAGEVPHLYHRERATEQVLAMEGVREVSNRLVTTSQQLLESIPDSPSDSELQLYLYEELRSDPRLKANQIQAQVEQRQVTLQGSTDTIFGQLLAGRIARQIFGIASVHNEIKIQKSAKSDEAIRQDVLKSLAADSSLDGQDVQVSVTNGTVTLSGKVSRNPIRRRVSSVVSRVSGVQAIHDDLSVDVSEQRGDEVIQREIAEQLQANIITREAATAIDVRVAAGEVTLTGWVNRYTVVTEAFRIAILTKGVGRVQNELQVRN